MIGIIKSRIANSQAGEIVRTSRPREETDNCGAQETTWRHLTSWTHRMGKR